MFNKISLATVGLIVGGVLASGGLAAYFLDNPTLNLAGFFYGIPLLLGGLALKAAELKPVPFTQGTAPEVLALRSQQATAIQNQLRRDVTRYRYGQQAHLDDSLKRLGLSPTDEERPVLQGLTETEIAGRYALVLEFDSPLVPFETWQLQGSKIEKFFGPGVRVDLTKASERQVHLALIATLEPV